MYFTIKWKYPLNDNRQEIFEQQVRLDGEGKVVDTPLQHVGMYIANLYNACKVEEDVGGYLESNAFAEWKNIVGDTYLEYNSVGRNGRFILFDSITYPAFCIYNNIRTMLNEIYCESKRRVLRDWSQCTKSILGERAQGEEHINPYSPEAVQTCIDKYIESYNELLMLSRGNFDGSFYEKLCETLKKYNGDKKINGGTRNLLKKYWKEKRGRCFATFIEDRTYVKYISFSGFHDAEDPIILRWLDRTKALEFVDVAKRICQSMGAIFVPINLETRRYMCTPTLPAAVYPDKSLGDMILLGLPIAKDDYSCCERKIFGYFKDNTPNGTLYVKMKICEKCSLGLLYQMRDGKTIRLFDGLEC